MRNPRPIQGGHSREVGPSPLRLASFQLAARTSDAVSLLSPWDRLLAAGRLLLVPGLETGLQRGWAEEQPAADIFLTFRVSQPAHPEAMPRRVEVIREV